MDTQKSYAPQTIGAIMATNIPTCSPIDSVGDVIKNLSQAGPWDTIHYVYAIDKNKRLLSFAKISKIIQTAPATIMQELLQPLPATVHTEDDQEKAIFLAVKHDLDAVVVVDADTRLLGAVTAKAIIDVMHSEHLEDSLLVAGIRDGQGVDIIKLATERLGLVLKSRAPWLIFGAVVGLGLGLISSFFEGALEKSIALAYFIPVVAYIADSVGTQSEAITIRALATLNVKAGNYLLREVLMGFLLGMLLGLMGAIGAALIAGSWQIGLVVGLSLLTASTIASSLAALIPIAFRKLGKDPALGSGPLATALQDVISVVIYFLFAIAIIR